MCHGSTEFGDLIYGYGEVEVWLVDLFGGSW